MAISYKRSVIDRRNPSCEKLFLLMHLRIQNKFCFKILLSAAVNCLKNIPEGIKISGLKFFVSQRLSFPSAFSVLIDLFVQPNVIYHAFTLQTAIWEWSERKGSKESWKIHLFGRSFGIDGENHLTNPLEIKLSLWIVMSF